MAESLSALRVVGETWSNKALYSAKSPGLPAAGLAPSPCLSIHPLD